MKTERRRKLGSMWAGGAALFLLCATASATVCNIHLVTDNAPDYTSMDSFIRSATANWSTDEEKILALFRWGARGRRQTSHTVEHGAAVLDPILMYTSYGNLFCTHIAGVNCAIWEHMGYPVRFIDVSNHTVSEVGYGGAFHLIDNSMTIYFRNHAGEIAGVQEVHAEGSCPDFNNGEPELGHIAIYHYGPEVGSCPDGWLCASDWHGRRLRPYGQNTMSVYNWREYYNNSEWGNKYTLNLRRFEYYTRFWEPQGATDDYYRPNAGGVDPDSIHNLYNIRGNGEWVFQPDLTSNDYRLAIYWEEGIESVDDSGQTPNLHPVAAGEPASVVFKVYGANVITSARIEAVLHRAGTDDAARISVSTNNGISWTEVYNHTGTGSVTADVQLKAEIGGKLEYLVKVDLLADTENTDAGLNSIKITTITQLNRRTLPKLTLGANRVQLFMGDQTESVLMWPSLYNDTYKNDIVDEYKVVSVETPSGYTAVLRDNEFREECHVSYRVDTPRDITRVSYSGRFYNRQSAGGVNSYVNMRHSFDGTTYATDAAITEVGMPWDDKLFVELEGADIPADSRSVWMRYVFFNGWEPSWTSTGAYSVLMRVHHLPVDNVFSPIEVTYNWTEHRHTGDVTRQHTALVTSLSGLEWTVNVAGYKDPTMNWVRINLQGHGPEGAGVTYGYSDGEDVGPGYGRQLRKYVWGNNLALGRPYTYSVEPGSFNGDPSNTEMTDGVIGMATTSYGQEGTPWMTLWDRNASPEITIDLGETKTVKAFRAWSIAPAYADQGHAHPERIEIEVSVDDVTYVPAGTIMQEQLWDPPGDYMPWEHDDSRRFNAVPHKGRKHYGFYKVLDSAVSARYVRYKLFAEADTRLGLTELQVFDDVTVSDWDEGLYLEPDLPVWGGDSEDTEPPNVVISTCDLAGTVSDDTSAPAVVIVDGVEVSVSEGEWSHPNVAVTSGSPISISATDASNNTRTVHVTITY
ncbi:MAG TPA: discoidin domain-containing protein [Planctomycetes bacterium]|mgnify:CR=1 FL=1|nr:discoidin domain-containing protein [Planctomycetota bacterium]